MSWDECVNMMLRVPYAHITKIILSSKGVSVWSERPFVPKFSSAVILRKIIIYGLTLKRITSANHGTSRNGVKEYQAGLYFYTDKSRAEGNEDLNQKHLKKERRKKPKNNSPCDINHHLPALLTPLIINPFEEYYQRK